MYSTHKGSFWSYQYKVKGEEKEEEEEEQEEERGRESINRNLFCH